MINYKAINEARIRASRDIKNLPSKIQIVLNPNLKTDTAHFNFGERGYALYISRECANDLQRLYRGIESELELISRKYQSSTSK